MEPVTHCIPLSSHPSEDASTTFPANHPGSKSRLGWLHALLGAALVFVLQAAFAPPSAQAAASSASSTASVAVEKVMPPEVLIGRTFEFVIRVTNLGDGELQDVTLTDTTEGGARIEDATPKAEKVEGKESTWRLGTLGPRQTREVRLRAVAIDETPITGCAVATFRPSACAATRVVRPAVELTKSLPAETVLCDSFPVMLTVRNSGTSALNGVQITDNLPEGLKTDSGESKKVFEVGRLNPGESREVRFSAKASRTGRFANTASATSAEGAEATAEAAINVLQPVLSLSCQTPPAKTLPGIPEAFVQFLGRPFEVCWEIGNSGNAPSANSRLEVVLPAGVEARSATDSGSASGRRLVWNLGPIAAGTTRKVCATLVAAKAGTYAFQASATGACAAPIESACSVRIQGVNAVLVELVDDPDPIQVGESTTYTIRVTNQGGGLDLQEVAVRVMFPDGMEPSAASNAGQIQARTVTWTPVPSIPLRQSLIYTVKGKGAVAGDHRLEVHVTARYRETPITEFESTTVY